MFRPHKGLSISTLLVLLLAIHSFTVHGRTLIAGENGSTEVAIDRQNTVREFYKLREKTLDERGSEKDVIQLLGLMTDRAIYEHPQANVKMTKEQAHVGMMAHLNEGKNAHITLHNIKAGTDFIVVELTLQYDMPAQNGALEQVTRRGMTIFEFAGNKIQRVAEY